MLQRYNPRRPPWTECMCCMRCTVCTVSELSLVSMPLTHGNPVVGSTPPSLACCSHPHAFVCTGISVSYRNRYVAVAPFSDMLPWHHFRYRCRGTIFVIVAVAPFSLSLPWHPFCSATMTKCFIMLLSTLSLKIA